MDGQVINNDIESLDLDYAMITKNTNDILNDMDMNEDDELLTKSIITNLEKDVVTAVKNNQIAGIPQIGTVRKSPIRQAVMEHKEELKNARDRLTKEEYAVHLKEFVTEERAKDIEKQVAKRVYRRTKIVNKKMYDKLVIANGFAHANLYIQSILWLDYVPFDEEVQDAFDRINNK